MRKHHVLNTVLATISRQQARRFSSRVEPFSAAVIGGGITGMTAAWRLCQNPKCTKVTLYERSPSLGGWLQSEKVEVEGGHVVFEYGPRTIRASKTTSMPIMDLLLSLGMQGEVLFHDKNSPAATNRFIYYPDHLVRLPGKQPGPEGKFSILDSLSTVLREPLFEGFLGALVTEFCRPVPNDRQDESVASFLSRRLNNAQAVENIASAVCHGIYAGDVHKLSSDVMIPLARLLERENGSITEGMMRMLTAETKTVPLNYLMAEYSVRHGRPRGHFDRIAELLGSASVITVRDGLAGITTRFVENFKAQSKLQVITDAQINSIKLGDDSDIVVSLKNGENVVSQAFNRVIATTPPTQLSKMISAGYPEDSAQRPTQTIARLNKFNYAVNVMVINLYYDQPNLVPHRGFGYLIPQSVPLEQNPERALGVTFGSETSDGQDTAPGTKLTVMMGGHWWDHWRESDIPTPEEAIAMSRRLLKRHLGIDETPAVARARFQREAVPQFLVNHIPEMRRLSDAVREDFNSRLTLAGNWYGVNGIGLTSCVAQAYLAASYGVGSFPEPPGYPAIDARTKVIAMEKQVGGVPTHPSLFGTTGKKRDWVEY
ncbi:protoporphyrinogen oxidase [Talaromyces islandicus]|uniref:Protoporphyrinogen oxidase n=1 Tax=Talaromyces islandicus TaxID=28573 RepID=A0A0U1M555_TALIS|nr:protoporphyrinogen oxidase [Talaromyces islandicus]